MRSRKQINFERVLFFVIFPVCLLLGWQGVLDFYLVLELKSSLMEILCMGGGCNLLVCHKNWSHSHSYHISTSPDMNRHKDTIHCYIQQVSKYAVVAGDTNVNIIYRHSTK